MILPPARDWRGTIAAHPIGERARNFRAELGLPTDRPIVMTGHQAELWHPGIVAKFFAADAAARTCGAAPAWIIVDQDDPPANTSLRWPDRETDGRLIVRTTDLQHATPAPPRTPPAPVTSSFSFVNDGLRRIRDAWTAAAPEPSAPRRLAAALASLLAPCVPAPPIIFATALARTGLFRDFVAAMAADPGACGGAYNAAARAHPSAGIRPLVADEVQDRFELPLWHLPPGGPRRRVYAESLDTIPTSELAPRALALTALLRLGACDLFIHGTGGGGGDTAHEGYDRVTEDWLESWARASPAAARLLAAPLAPVGVVTATRRLPLIEGPVPTEAEVARAFWAAHHARSDPAMLGEPDAARRKLALVSQIRASPRHGRERRSCFLELHALLDRIDGAHAPALAALDERARHARALRAGAAIAQDRTWAFPLYPEPVIRGLHEEIEDAFDA